MNTKNILFGYVYMIGGMYLETTSFLLHHTSTVNNVAK